MPGVRWANPASLLGIGWVRTARAARVAVPTAERSPSEPFVVACGGGECGGGIS